MTRLRAQLTDLLERSVWTFLEAFGAAVVVGELAGFSALKVALMAGAIAVAKCITTIATVHLKAVLARSLEETP